MTSSVDPFVDPTASSARGPGSPPVLDETLGDLLRRILGTVPDQLALFGTHDERRWTYAKLLADSEAAARTPLARFQPGERIAIWAQNVLEWVLAELALGIAELPIVTVNPDLGAQEAAYVLDPWACR